MLGDCKDRLATPSDEEVHRIVHYCLCLHLITRELAASPELSRAVLDHQQRALRSQSDWWKYLSAFEHAKLITPRACPHLLLVPPRAVGRNRAPTNPRQLWADRLTVQYLRGRAAGCSLLPHRHDNGEQRVGGHPVNPRPAWPGGQTGALSDDSRRAVRMPLAQKWKDLYIAWNVAFTSNYQDAPYFAAALLCPCILGASPDEFMFHRTFALHLHASAQIRARSRGAYRRAGARRARLGGRVRQGQSNRYMGRSQPQSRA